MYGGTGVKVITPFGGKVKNEWSYTSTAYALISFKTKCSKRLKLHSPSTLPTGKGPAVPSKYEDGWTLRHDLNALEKRKIRTKVGVQTYRNFLVVRLQKYLYCQPFFLD
jgi:hypothetical protein